MALNTSKTFALVIENIVKEKIEPNARELNFLPKQAQLPI